MRVCATIAMLCCLVGLLTGLLLADDPLAGKVRQLEEPLVIPDDGTAEIQIEIRKGRFSNDFVITADRKNMVHAAVEAGGVKYWLDFRQSPKAEQALIDANVMTHGDARQPKIYITGSLRLSPLDASKPAAGLRPIVVVKTFQVKLEAPGQATPKLDLTNQIVDPIRDE